MIREIAMLTRKTNIKYWGKANIKYWGVAALVSVVSVVILVVLVRWGWADVGYSWIWQHTTGRPWTFIMRDYPILLVVPLLAILAVAARWLPLRYWARIVFLDIVLVIGVVAGHVFW